VWTFTEPSHYRLLNIARDATNRATASVRGSAGMSSPETVKPANTLQALNSGSGLDKLGAPVDAQYVSSDNEGVHTDTHDTDLNDLLQIAHCEEVERMAMLDRCVGYDDASFGAADLTREDTFATNDGSDVNNGSTHGMDFARQVRTRGRSHRLPRQTQFAPRAFGAKEGAINFGNEQQNAAVPRVTRRFPTLNRSGNTHRTTHHVVR